MRGPLFVASVFWWVGMFGWIPPKGPSEEALVCLEQSSGYSSPRLFFPPILDSLYHGARLYPMKLWMPQLHEVLTNPNPKLPNPKLPNSLTP